MIQMNRNQRFVLGASLIVILLIYLASTGITSNQYEVSEAIAEKQSLEGKIILVNGSMVAGTDKWDPLNRTLRFKMTDGIATMDVVYTGEKPNIPSRYSYIQVVVTGRFNGSEFQAYKMITKCPSKYGASSENIVK